MKNLTALDAHRVALHGQMGDAQNGAFHLPYKTSRYRKKVQAWLYVIASSGADWDHVSVSVDGQRRTPVWAEMAWIKDQFFDPEDCVMQLHPPASRYVNNHDYVLHLWRPQHEPIPQPDTWMVGILGVTPDEVAALLGV
jgi:hypothetical protein